MKRIFMICFFMFFAEKAFSQSLNEGRLQYVKWNVGLNYSLGILRNSGVEKEAWISKNSATLSVDVLLSHLLHFDSGELYLQPYIEGSLPIQDPYNSKLKFSTYGGGLNLKKYITLDSGKTRFFVIAGGKIDYVLWTLDYTSSGSLQEKQYRIKNMDYVTNLGIGIAVSDWAEVFTMYSQGFAKAYLSDTPENRDQFKSFSLGLRVNIRQNKWFKN